MTIFGGFTHELHKTGEPGEPQDQMDPDRPSHRHSGGPGGLRLPPERKLGTSFRTAQPWMPDLLPAAGMVIGLIRRSNLQPETTAKLIDENSAGNQSRK